MTDWIKISALVALAGVILLLGATPVPAQPPRTPYTPTPTFSPWLNMYRADPGPLGPYLSYVRPEQRLRQTLTDQQSRIGQQQTELDTLRRQATTLGTRGSTTPTGVGGTFMNYSHYYSFGRR